MAETRLLSLVLRYPHPRALARRVRDGSVFSALRQLETRGLVRREHGEYRLTGRGLDELRLRGALGRLLARSVPPAA